MISFSLVYSLFVEFLFSLQCESQLLQIVFDLVLSCFVFFKLLCLDMYIEHCKNNQIIGVSACSRLLLSAGPWGYFVQILESKEI